MQGIRWQPTEQQAHLQYLCELLRLLLHLYLELGAQSLHSKAVRGAAGAVQQGCDRIEGVVHVLFHTNSSTERDLGRQQGCSCPRNRLQPLATDQTAASLMVH